MRRGSNPQGLVQYVRRDLAARHEQLAQGLVDEIRAHRDRRAVSHLHLLLLLTVLHGEHAARAKTV